LARRAVSLKSRNDQTTFRDFNDIARRAKDLRGLLQCPVNTLAREAPVDIGHGITTEH